MSFKNATRKTSRGGGGGKHPPCGLGLSLIKDIVNYDEKWYISALLYLVFFLICKM